MLGWKIRISRGGNKQMPPTSRHVLKFGLACVAALLLSTLWTSPLAAQTNNEATTSPPPTTQKNAAPSPQAAPVHPTHSAHRHPTLDDRVKALAKTLDLTEPQQTAVKRILEQRQAETLRLLYFAVCRNCLQNMGLCSGIATGLVSVKPDTQKRNITSSANKQNAKKTRGNSQRISSRLT